MSFTIRVSRQLCPPTQSYTKCAIMINQATTKATLYPSKMMPTWYNLRMAWRNRVPFPLAPNKNVKHTPKIS